MSGGANLEVASRSEKRLLLPITGFEIGRFQKVSEPLKTVSCISVQVNANAEVAIMTKKEIKRVSAANKKVKEQGFSADE